jgi:hypothetical protein
MNYENLPNDEMVDVYLKFRVGSDDEKRELVANIVAGTRREYNAVNFINQDEIEPFWHPDGGTLWVSPENFHDAVVESRRNRPFTPQSVNQVMVIENWNKPIYGYSNQPFFALWDKEN